MTGSFGERRAQVAGYLFRDIHPNVQFGTVSDRYAAWIGQIYSQALEAAVSSRPKKLEGGTFEERLVPVSSVAEYFRHFGVLELDLTFYRPLLEPDGKPSTNLRVLREYAEHAPDDALFLLKAPQAFFARKLRRAQGGQVRYEDNPHFLDATAYTEQFLEPAFDVMAERILGVIFEQEYQRVQDAPPAEQAIAELDGFFSHIPDDVQSHVELRSPHLLNQAYFDWLEARGVGFVFSHWTWLPALREQWKLCEGRFTAGDGNVVARLLSPLRMPYAEAYAKAHPFDNVVPELAGTKEARNMVLDATALAFQAEKQGATLNVIMANRAWGNAPALAQTIANRILDEEVKRSRST